MADLVLNISAGIGVPPVRFGMSISDARANAEPWGDVTNAPNPGGPPRLRAQDADGTVDVFLNFEKNDALTSIEIWRPELDPDVRRVSVEYDGIDIFQTPASEVLERLAATGAAVHDSDVYFPVVTTSDIALGFNREGGEYVDEEADDGVSLIFNSVLVAPAGYYDSDL